MYKKQVLKGKKGNKISAILQSACAARCYPCLVVSVSALQYPLLELTNFLTELCPRLQQVRAPLLRPLPSRAFVKSYSAFVAILQCLHRRT